ncbi:hypothetical protein Tco_1305513 [Tanacetum coccineum]
MAPMALSDSKVNNDKSCSKTCLTNYETLKKQYDDLIFKLHETEFKAATYKRGLAIVEDQLVTFRKNEILFSEEIAVLKREVGCKNYEISVFKTEFEKVKQEKEGIEFKIEKFDSASKSLDKLLESQITAHTKTAVHSAKSKTHFSKQAQSTAKRPFYKQTALTRIYVHEAKRHYYTIRHYAINTARSYSGQVNVVRVKRVNDVKSLAYWVWRPTKSNGVSLAFKRHNYIDGKPQYDDKGFVDSGCSRHMTGNIAYLSDFKLFDEGYVVFGGGVYGGKITGK